MVILPAGLQPQMYQPGRPAPTTRSRPSRARYRVSPTHPPLHGHRRRVPL